MADTNKKTRLDQLIFDKGLSPSRERAKTTIMSGLVFVNGQRADKPGMMVPRNASIEVRGDPLPYVSRGGLKLEKALKVFPVDVAGKICIDCGASTGGFTDVLLQSGAKKVYAVDVGYGQLAWKLRNDERVVNLERTNLRYITRELVPEQPEIAVMDVAFISVRLVLLPVAALLHDGADIICLIKPQFEAGREEVGKKGVVKDAKIHCDVIRSVLSFASDSSLSVRGLDFSPVKGPEGNIEFISHLKKSDESNADIDIESVVLEAHSKLSAEGDRL